MATIFDFRKPERSLKNELQKYPLKSVFILSHSLYSSRRFLNTLLSAGLLLRSCSQIFSTLLKGEVFFDIEIIDKNNTEITTGKNKKHTFTHVAMAIFLK